MRIINLTPHEIKYINGKTVYVFDKAETPARVSAKVESCNDIPLDVGICSYCGEQMEPHLSCENCGCDYEETIPLQITKTTFGQVENLPPKKLGHKYIVSRMVAEACPNRDDLLIVNETVRDENGRIIGCKSFSINPFFKE